VIFICIDKSYAYSQSSIYCAEEYVLIVGMKTLEGSKFFVYVAWATVIGFASFVVMLAFRLMDVAEVIAAGGVV